MSTTKQKNALVSIGIGFLVCLLMISCAALNVQSFQNSYYEVLGDGSRAMAASIVKQLEDSLQYGKTLENYYGIEEFFREIEQSCGPVERSFIADETGQVLYQSDTTPVFDASGEAADALQQALEGQPARWQTAETQTILLPISLPQEGRCAVFGITYDITQVTQQLGAVSRRIYTAAFAVSGAALAALFVLMRVVSHRFQVKRILLFLSPLVIGANIVLGVFAYQTFRQGYADMMHTTAVQFEQKVAWDINKVVSQGVYYTELYGIDTYYEEMLSGVAPIDSVLFSLDGFDNSLPENALQHELPPDATGQKMTLAIVPNERYLQDHLGGIMLDMAVNICLSLLMMVEMLLFLLAFAERKPPSPVPVVRNPSVSTQPVGIARGMNFCFCLFQYMSLAFVSVVLVSIYQPIFLFSWEIPKALVLALPLSIQIFTSMLTSGLAGGIISKKGWKPVAVWGIWVMTAGTLLAGFSKEPSPFLLAQLIIGVGLGFAKTAFDVYSTLVACDDEISLYTSHTNAAAIIGMSCASALGGVLASSLGYSNTYFVIAVVGVLTALLFQACGQNILEHSVSAEACTSNQAHAKAPLDMRFLSYLLFLILPYSFIMEFVDYFFPVFANSAGVSIDQIGYVLFVYGLVSAYFGTWLCNRLSKRWHCAAIIVVTLLVLCAGIGLFSVYPGMLMAIGIVMLVALSDGLMPSQQFQYVYDLPTSKRIGFTRALSIEGVISSAIRGISPFIFSLLLAYGMHGLSWVAAVIFICAVCFGAIHRFTR